MIQMLQSQNYFDSLSLSLSLHVMLHKYKHSVYSSFLMQCTPFRGLGCFYIAFIFAMAAIIIWHDLDVYLFIFFSFASASAIQSISLHHHQYSGHSKHMPANLLATERFWFEYHHYFLWKDLIKSFRFQLNGEYDISHRQNHATEPIQVHRTFLSLRFSRSRIRFR